MKFDATTLSVILAAVIGGGGLMPFLYRVFGRWRSHPIEEEKRRVEIEAMSTHAATETVKMMKGVLGVLNQQLHERQEENVRLRDERTERDAKIARLEAKVTELIEQVRSLGGHVADLPEAAA